MTLVEKTLLRTLGFIGYKSFAACSQFVCVASCSICIVVKLEEIAKRHRCETRML